MVQVPATYFQCAQTFNSKPHAHTHTHTKLHICPKYPFHHYNPIVYPHIPRSNSKKGSLTPTADFSETEASTEMTMTCYLARTAEEVRREQVQEPPEYQHWKSTCHKKQTNTQIRITTTNKYKPLRHIKTEGNSRHERKGPAPPPIFVSGITYTSDLTVTVEQVINRPEYNWKTINNYY
jgi:hypothetical protein